MINRIISMKTSMKIKQNQKLQFFLILRPMFRVRLLKSHW